MTDNTEQQEITLLELEEQKKAYLNLLLDTNGYESLNVATTQVLGDNLGKPGKRYEFYKEVDIKYIPKNIDYRSTLSNEIIFEIDHKVWSRVQEAAEKIIHQLESLNIPYEVTLSGGKSVHISVFFKFNKSEKVKTLINECRKKGYLPSFFRIDLVKLIVQQAGYSKKYVGDGKFFDTSTIHFNELEGKSKLIRIIGGRKYNKTNVEIKLGYKKRVTDVPKRKNDLSKRNNFNFPNKIELWTIEESIVTGIFNAYLKRQENQPQTYTYPITNINGGFLQLKCVQNMLNNIKNGIRHTVAYVLTCACKCDGLSKDECGNKLDEYYKYFPEQNSFSKTELKSWIREVYNVWNADFTYAHKILIRERWCDGDCDYYEKQYNEIIKFLKNESLLYTITEIVQQKINGRQYKKLIGEEQNILHLFLVYLSAYTNDPQNRHLEGDTATGKTFTVTAVLDYFPPEDQITVAGMTKKAIYYDSTFNPDTGRLEYDLNNKMITLLEESESFEFLKEIKPILSHDMKEIQYKTTVEQNKQKVTESIFIIGWPVYVGLSVLMGYRHREQESREWTISINDAKEKFDKTTENVSKKNVFTTDELHPQTLLLKETIKFLKSIIREYKVHNPYLRSILPLFSSGDSRVQRDVKRFISMIEIITLLHIYQRNILFTDKIKAVVTEPIDIYYALGICQESIKPLFSGILTKYYKYFIDLFEDGDTIYTEKEFDVPDGEETVAKYTLDGLCKKFNDKYNKNMDKYNFKKIILNKCISNNLVIFENKDSDKRTKVYLKNKKYNTSTDSLLIVSDKFKAIIDKISYIKNANFDEKTILEGISNAYWGVLKNKKIRKTEKPNFLIFSSPPPLITNILFSENTQLEVK